jgi:Xaa-Pro dipeptidase
MINLQEVDEKKARVRSLMARLKLDAVLLRKQCNFSWLTGGHLNLVGIATEMGAALLLLTPETQYVICNNIEAPRIEKEEGILEQGYELVTYTWFEEWERELIERLSKKGRVGSDSPYPGTEDISNHINPLRYSLTPWEVGRYKELGLLASSAVEATTTTIEPGDKECEVIGRLAQRLWANRVDFVTTFCAADERIANFHH